MYLVWYRNVSGLSGKRRPNARKRFWGGLKPLETVEGLVCCFVPTVKCVVWQRAGQVAGWSYLAGIRSQWESNSDRFLVDIYMKSLGTSMWPGLWKTVASGPSVSLPGGLLSSLATVVVIKSKSMLFTSCNINQNTSAARIPNALRFATDENIT